MEHPHTIYLELGATIDTITDTSVLWRINHRVKTLVPGALEAYGSRTTQDSTAVLVHQYGFHRWSKAWDEGYKQGKEYAHNLSREAMIKAYRECEKIIQEEINEVKNAA